MKSIKDIENIPDIFYNQLNILKAYNDLSIRFSMNNLKKDGKIINIPLFLIEYIEKFI